MTLSGESTLPALGVRQASCRPDSELRTVRALARHRAALLRHRAPHINPMQLALKLLNIQLSSVRSDITGQTGQAIVRARVAGERDPRKLAA
jgi:transposase